MNIEQFNKTEFRAGDEFFYQGQWHNVASVNLDEALIAFDTSSIEDDDMNLVWLRCESIEEYKPYKE